MDFLIVIVSLITHKTDILFEEKEFVELQIFCNSLLIQKGFN